MNLGGSAYGPIKNSVLEPVLDSIHKRRRRNIPPVMPSRPPRIVEPIEKENQLITFILKMPLIIFRIIEVGANVICIFFIIFIFLGLILGY